METPGPKQTVALRWFARFGGIDQNVCPEVSLRRNVAEAENR